MMPNCRSPNPTGGLISDGKSRKLLYSIERIVNVFPVKLNSWQALKLLDAQKMPVRNEDS